MIIRFPGAAGRLAAPVAALALLIPTADLRAEDTTWADLSGQAIAEALCAQCHAVGLHDTSADPGAPPFRILAQRWPLEYLEEALAEGIVVGHGAPDMPEYSFSPDEIGALLGYMATIQVPAETSE